jgi:hypothetical protein
MISPFRRNPATTGGQFQHHGNPVKRIGAMRTWKSLLIAAPVAAGLLAAPAAHAEWRGGPGGWHGGGGPAWHGGGGGWHGGGPGWGGGPRYYNHGGGNGGAVAGAVIGLGLGAILGGVIASQPYYAAPPPVVYAAPPPVVYAPPPQAYYAAPVYAPPGYYQRY